MSCSALRQAGEIQKLCQGCRGRKARFRYRGAVRADRDHTLCFECFRSERERLRARALAGHDLPCHRSHLQWSEKESARC